MIRVYLLTVYNDIKVGNERHGVILKKPLDLRFETYKEMVEFRKTELARYKEEYHKHEDDIIVVWLRYDEINGTEFPDIGVRFRTDELEESNPQGPDKVRDGSIRKILSRWKILP